MRSLMGSGVAIVAFGLAAVLHPAFAQKGSAEGRFKACQEKLKSAQKLEVLHDLRFDKGQGWKVFAGPTYFRIPIDAKEGFAETLNCFFVAGDNGKCMNFPILDWRTGRRVARYENCRLKVD